MNHREIMKKIGTLLLCLCISFTQIVCMSEGYSVKADTSKKYTVIYSANRGYGVPYSQTKYHDVPLQLTTTEPSRSGYVFMGWGTDSNSSKVVYKPGDTYWNNSSITLYAVWGTVDGNGHVSPSAGNTKPAWSYTPSYSGVNKITAQSKTVTYGSKPFKLNAKAEKGGTLTYSSSSKTVATVSSSGRVLIKGYGKTTITIKSPASGTFSADTKRITVTVVPKKMKIKKVQSPMKTGISISWKKDKTVSGYQIKISRVMNFKSKTKTATISKKKSNVKLRGLTRKKLYYVRIRAYKKVGANKYYGSWSKTKRVKIK